MNAVEIAEAVSELAAAPYVRNDFPYQFLAALGFKETTISKLKSGTANKSDVAEGVLLRGNIHLATAEPGKAGETLATLKLSPQTIKGKAKFILATDGEMVEAEELSTGEPLSCHYTGIHDHFGFFLPLAGISTVAEIKDNPIDIRATGRLNKLYLELLKDNPEWATDKKRPALNQFMARLIFCFFAEDTGIFNHAGMFTECLRQMSEASSANTDEVIQELFRAMNTAPEKRKAANLKRWAEPFPYVNGGLFAEDIGCPKFSKIARSYLLRAGDLDWKEINPDIFGSMIQAVADDDERGSLGMHYTSVPNILKVLDPLFLDDLRQQLEEAEDNPRKLLNLRKRIANIRVFDPACGSGNFLVIAYQKMREIEAEIIKRRQDDEKKSWIKLTNFYGIEIKTFAAEIARLALLVSEFKANVTHIGQREACLDVLPLHETGKIRTGNALRVEWAEVCPPCGNQADEEETASETYVCGNPPYRGSQWQSNNQKSDLVEACGGQLESVGSADYVAGWFFKAQRFLSIRAGASAFVSTNSLCQGRQVSLLWPVLLADGFRILFAYPSFKWSNLAAEKAGVTVSIIGYGKPISSQRLLIDENVARAVENISPYLVGGHTCIVEPESKPISNLNEMVFGNMPNDGGALLCDFGEALDAINQHQVPINYIRQISGSNEFINGISRYCVWVSDNEVGAASKNEWLLERFNKTRTARLASKRATTRELAKTPYRFGEIRQRGQEKLIVIPAISSENRSYLPCGVLAAGSIASNKIYAMLDAPLWNLSILCSRLHLVWIATVCVRLRTDYSYSNTLGWNTFPVPELGENDKADLTRCAEDILLAREAHFPATIADLYAKDSEGNELMPADLRAAHDRNDETLERIYIGRKFKNDTERLEKLFDMYTKMTKDEGKTKKTGTRRKRAKPAEKGDQQ